MALTFQIMKLGNSATGFSDNSCDYRKKYRKQHQAKDIQDEAYYSRLDKLFSDSQSEVSYATT